MLSKEPGAYFIVCIYAMSCSKGKRYESQIWMSSMVSSVGLGNRKQRIYIPDGGGDFRIGMYLCSIINKLILSEIKR
jgi:hypothetical protein